MSIEHDGKRPCVGCPFRRDTPAGDLRGQSVRRFIGQAYGPFLLPCHKLHDKEGWGELSTKKPQCVGAAMFRDAIGIADRLPDALSRAKFDPEYVFATVDEYLAHHEQLTLLEARVELLLQPVEEMLLIELSRPTVRRPKE